MEFDFDAVEEEDSPYVEVRASVSNIDDPEMPCLTIRMWFVGMLLLAIVAAANIFFNFRSPAPVIYPNVITLTAYPLGKFLAYALPITTYRLPKWLGGGEFSLNPGPWNIKEHACVYMMANVASGSPYAINAIVVAEMDYNQQSLGFWFSVVLVLSTQVTGYALAGLCRSMLVRPASMIWPSDLITCTLLNTLHAEEDEARGGISRYRHFVYVTLGAFFFFFLPGYLFTGLSFFSWVCWIKPDSIPLAQVFGMNGMGVLPFTFDWTQISWIANPLMIPWWAGIQTFIGFVAFYWVLLPALYYSDTWHFAHFPMFSSGPYDRFGHAYNVTRVLGPKNTLDLNAYNAYSPLYLPGAYAITYLVAFMLSSAVLVHTGLYYGPMLVRSIKKIRVEKDDIHAKLMRSYPEVPDWWYVAVFVSTFGLTVVANEVWHTGLPLWGMILAILLPLVYMLPAGFIYATSGQVIALNLLAQAIPGGLLPGKPLATMIFKGYSIQVLIVALSFVQDLKLGHYIKVPPRASFVVQLIAVTFAGVLQIGVKEWIFSSVPDICQPHQKSSLTCPYRSVHFTSSAIWGLIGPTRQFGKDSQYYPEVYCVLIGVLLPIPFWWWQRRRPNKWNTYISTPVLLNAVTYIPPATGINYSSWILVSFIFQFWVRRKSFAWWSKFNYVTSAALDIGTLFSVLFIFFALQFPRDGSITLDWWGNNVWKQTADFFNLPLVSTPPEGF
ncbi:OPT superfamily oligopeptide transporter [Trametopsis cervina]|nr:OPT superfamily oligopeptide transporter [Trametopsis cervina]